MRDEWMGFMWGVVGMGVQCGEGKAGWVRQ